MSWGESHFNPDENSGCTKGEVYELVTELNEAQSEIDRHHELIERLKEIISHKDSLLACYRVGKSPSGRLMDDLARDREFLARQVG